VSKIKTIEHTMPDSFTRIVNKYLKEGYKVISSYCTSAYSSDYASVETCYQAILLNETETASEEELDMGELLPKYNPYL
jgi:hypothetical protein